MSIAPPSDNIPLTSADVSLDVMTDPITPSISAVEAAAYSVESRPCVHCGLPTTVPQVQSQSQLVFCCNGCKGAYELIKSWGLNDFYALRNQMTVNGAALSAGTQAN
jgi:Cu2+-exporting ATPase